MLDAVIRTTVSTLWWRDKRHRTGEERLRFHSFTVVPKIIPSSVFAQDTSWMLAEVLTAVNIRRFVAVSQGGKGPQLNQALRPVILYHKKMSVIGRSLGGEGMAGQFGRGFSVRGIFAQRAK
jgi:hypothetical protein